MSQMSQFESTHSARSQLFQEKEHCLTLKNGTWDKLFVRSFVRDNVNSHAETQRAQSSHRELIMREWKHLRIFGGFCQKQLCNQNKIAIFVTGTRPMF